MAKLTKAQTKNHTRALEILSQDKLNIEERFKVLELFHEGAETNNGAIGAHFTPIDLAMDMALDMYGGGRVLDLCAGIGTLSLANALRTNYTHDYWPEMVCIEQNPYYVEIGKKLLPEATWICGDIFDLDQMDLGHFDGVHSNPPFGASAFRNNNPIRYKGRDFEFHVIDLAAEHAEYGCFLLPQNSAPFVVSGQRGNHYRDSGKGRDFEAVTGFEMHPGCGVDTAMYRDKWKSTAIICEIVTIEFSEFRQAPIKVKPVEIETEPTAQGLQYVMPGCTRDRSKQTGQLDFWS